MRVFVCVTVVGEVGACAAQNESRDLKCGAEWQGSFCHFTCTAGVACQ